MQSTECKEARRQRDIALRDFEEVNNTLIDERSSLAKAESSLKEQESLCRQLQEKYDVFKVKLQHTRILALRFAKSACSCTHFCTQVHIDAHLC